MLVAVLLMIATVLPIADIRQWWVRLLDFPRVQIVLAQLSMVLIYALWFGWGSPPSAVWPSLLVISALYQIVWIRPHTIFHSVEVLAADADQATNLPRLRILSSNVLMENRDASRLLAHVVTEQPDILIALETDRWWQGQLDTLDSYPYRLAHPLDNRYGMHLYSRRPLHDTAIEFLVEEGIPSMVAFVELDEGLRVRLHALHPTPPVPGENTRSTERDVELLLVAHQLENNDDITVVVGDLNDVAWSKTTQLFRQVSGLLDPRVGRGMFNSFHADYWFARWPLDHVFVSDHFRLVDVRRLSTIGSDHFPMLIDLVVDEQNPVESHTDREHIDEGLERGIMESDIGKQYRRSE